ncbi:YebC/PmpR family DNA-binding transcriptional regulator [Rickettsiales endosymbiont of Trichoplax sp. H2]|uniref:YebC/PmpR family DNA-binding transcriptional regulator n=1 Tax=Rickettsiales endosymbiont of Trichoplax sp. H2 TaxID=2021221 RepID=UPI0012B403D6|nr:YebC/PmpR family DNA-binding transcriptional regulator [Rickettsiales endosymbiont of Trichoplax sp. H2]MSO14206.1 putative transcriptional regulatory protein [Rickettsiales endosymbiont of Trichoplax sp. H2]
MAGHSKFKNIMHRKGAQDKKRAKAFTRAVKEIIVAAKSGMPDPNFNPRLRTAITAAKQANLPKDKIDNAIKKATSADNDVNYDEIRYEGYGPGGVAIIVETLTDNKNRTASEVRAAFSKNGGALGEPGSVGYMFKKVGSITYEESNLDKNQLIDDAIEFEADDCTEKGNFVEIITNTEKYSEISDSLENKFSKPFKSQVKWVADTLVELDGEKSEKVFKLLEVLDNLDDVQSVHSNHKFLS